MENFNERDKMNDGVYVGELYIGGSLCWAELYSV